MNQIQKIAKNASFLLIGYVISYIIGFFTLIYTAKYLGAENFGILSLALAFTGIFVFSVDLGLNILIVREVSRDKSLTNKYTANTVAIKLVSSFLTFGLVFLIVTILGYSQKVIDVIYLIFLYTCLISFSGIFNAIFQAHEKMEYQSISTILTGVLTLSGVLVVIYFKLDVISFAILYSIVSLVILIYSFLIYSWKVVSPKIEIDLSFWKPTLKESWPFGITNLFVTIFYSIDSVILSVMVSITVVGWYNAAYNLINALLVIPTVLNIVIFPVMSQFYQTSKDSLRIASEKYFKYMSLLGIPLGVGTTLLADKIILLIFGTQYTPSIIALQILVWSTVFIFMSGSFARLLEASNKQVTLTKITAICVVINIVLNIILIPKFSYIAASAIT
ncbi:MAG: flippase, partial [Methanobacterium paludis]|nr:flippase [Methanobacterium paludis]